jgi:hypothetical protein
LAVRPFRVPFKNGENGENGASSVAAALKAYDALAAGASTGGERNVEQAGG